MWILEDTRKKKWHAGTLSSKLLQQGMSFDELKKGGFHRQKDRGQTKKLMSLIYYALEHDK